MVNRVARITLTNIDVEELKCRSNGGGNGVVNVRRLGSGGGGGNSQV